MAKIHSDSHRFWGKITKNNARDYNKLNVAKNQIFADSPDIHRETDKEINGIKKGPKFVHCCLIDKGVIWKLKGEIEGKRKRERSFKNPKK